MTRNPTPAAPPNIIATVLPVFPPLSTSKSNLLYITRKKKLIFQIEKKEKSHFSTV